MTAGELRTLLESVPDDVHVVVATEGWYDTVDHVVIPDGEDYWCVTVFTGAAWDARSL